MAPEVIPGILALTAASVIAVGGVVTTWLTYRRTGIVAKDVQVIHHTINSTAMALATEREADKARLVALTARVAELEQHHLLIALLAKEVPEKLPDLVAALGQVKPGAGPR